MASENSVVRVIRADEGARLGDPNTCTDRFLISRSDSDGRFSVVEHMIAPGALAAPMHRHTKEDEFSLVVEGTFAALLGGQFVTAEPGDLVFKPRNEWHTFWNPGTTPTRVIEIISPAGLEEFFRLLDVPDDEKDFEAIERMSAEIGCDVDEAATKRVIEEHGLRA